jgi:hypothetical protein
MAMEAEIEAEIEVAAAVTIRTTKMAETVQTGR